MGNKKNDYTPYEPVFIRIAMPEAMKGGENKCRKESERYRGRKREREREMVVSP
jgi:hypothetical protein